MAKPRILCPTHKLSTAVDIPVALPEFKQFKEDFEVIIKQYADIKDLIHDLQTEFKDIQAIFATPGLGFRLGGFTDEVIESLPSSLKVVGFAWVGGNSFAPEKLRERGIDLVNVGNASAHEVADAALSLVLSTFRYTAFFERTLRSSGGDMDKARSYIGSDAFDEDGIPIISETENNWTEKFVLGGNQIESPNGKIAALVGLGSIGKEIAKRLNAIGLKVRYTKRTPLSEEEVKSLPFEVEYFPSFEEVISGADLIVLAVPHTPQTINLINEGSLKLVKKGVRIVNIGRGSAIDEDALFKALDDGTVNSVGLDVFVNEPHIDKRFLNRPNVTITPHLGSFTLDNFVLSNVVALNGIRTILTGDGKKVSIIN